MKMSSGAGKSQLSPSVTASTPNFLWSMRDVLGQGATSTVYKARNKRSGQLVAVKVFNYVSHSSTELQLREFEMLRKLNHVNIVGLFAVEELPTKQKVIVMEYCSEGSLLNLLEVPENIYGLPETEFITVLECIVHGMNHLRECGVVHRDIKPGNIMRQAGDNGRFVYKLTDFGTARELEDNERFLSICGTEEYLHPDMYEPAVLRKPQMKSYGVSVDLWSIGVTLYHTATGNLPFIPYGGPRNNKVTMFKITTQKPVGAIAGSQLEPGGPIKWSFELPSSCQLSQGLKFLLVPVLAGIMEADQERCWGFDQFFTATTDILQRQPVYLFSLQQAMAFSIYVHHYDTMSAFFEEVTAHTGVKSQQQHLMYLGYDLTLESTMKVVNLPSTSPSQPLILLSSIAEDNTSLPIEEPEIPPIPGRFHVVKDFSFSLTIMGISHRFKRSIQLLHTSKNLLLQGYYSYIMKMHHDARDAMHNIVMITIRSQSSLTTKRHIHKLSFHSSENEGSIDGQKLQLVHRNLPAYTSVIQDIQSRLDHLLIKQAKLAEVLASDKSCQKMDMLLKKIKGIHKLFENDKKMQYLPYNDEQIHKFEKINLSHLIKQMKSLFKEESVVRYKEVLEETNTWSRVLMDLETQLLDFHSFSHGLLADLEMNEHQQNKAMDELLHFLLLPRAEGQPRNATRDKDQMISGMHHLRDEMELLVRELQCNNGIIESIRAVNSAAPLEHSQSSTSTL